MRLGAPSLEQLVRRTRSEPQVFPPRVVPHPAGTWIGLGSVALGAWAHERDVPPAVQWVALAGLLVGMGLYARLKRADDGWQVDFASRSIAPHGLPGEAVTLDDSGWSLACAGRASRLGRDPTCGTPTAAASRGCTTAGRGCAVRP